MTAVDRIVNSPADVLVGVRHLAPEISRRAAEIETARRLPDDLVHDLARVGCFRMLRPESHGGLATSAPDAMRIFEELARADASVGWTVMIGAGSWIDLSGLPRSSFDALFADRPDAITAGAFNPSGTLTPDDGGYRVDGRWAFASGCEHADWIWANGIEGIVDGRPQLRTAVFAPDQVEIEDTWHVSGLRGTGSHHVRVDGVVVAADRTYVPLADEPCIDTPIVRVPIPSTIGLAVASVATGIARGALDDLVDQAAEKVPLLAAGTLADDPVFRNEFAAAETELAAARALLYETAEEAWARAVADREFTLEHRARMRAAGVWAANHAAGVVETAYRFAGGGAVYATNPLQRRLRDVNALTQHFIVRPATFTTAGGILAGRDVEVAVF